MRFIRARFYIDGGSKSRTRGKKSPSISSSNASSGTSLDRIDSGPDPEVVQERRRRRPNTRPLYKPRPDHNPNNCEACLLRRCPRPWRYPTPDKEHEIPGADLNNNQDMEFISW